MSTGRRIPAWVLLPLAGVGILIAAVCGLWAFMWSTAEVLHPDAALVPTVTERTPDAQWGSAVSEARQIVKSAMASRNLPGLSVAVGVGGQLVWAEGFGLADVEKKLAMRPDQRLRIGSASIAVTSVAVGLLVEEGRIRLDDEIQKYVPQFPRKKWPVTVRQLMAHVAGLDRDRGDDETLLYQNCSKPVDGLVEFAGRELRFEPGTKYRYSSYGWILLSAAVEQAAGRPFFEFVEERIFKVAGMTKTSLGGEVATGYFPRFAADTRYGLQLLPEVDLGCLAGAGAWMSTPSDLARFAMAVGAGKLLRTKTLRLFETEVKLANGEQTGYGLGWDVETVKVEDRHIRVTGHDGEVLAGNVASLIRMPDHGVVVAVVSNVSHADTFSIAAAVSQEFAKGRP